MERRLLAAHEDWLSFAQDRSARLLYWHANEADQALLKVFFQAQGELSNAILELNAPFEDAVQYALALSDEVIAFYDARREGSARLGITADWTPPPSRNALATEHLLSVLESLMAHHPDIFPGLVLVLQPAQISKVRAFEQWLDTLLTRLSEKSAYFARRVRFVLYGSETSAFMWLASQQPQAMRLVSANYRMQALPRELVADSAERGSAGQFRRLFVELSESVEHEDPARLEKLRSAALAVSDGRQWFDQSAVVHLLAGAAYLKWKSGKQALSAYQQAGASGQRAIEAEHPAGYKLVVNGLFGEASVHLTDERYLSAARCYETAATFAHADKDSVLLVESYRMQAWCLDRERYRDEALDAGFAALQAGQGIGPALRSNGNLQLVVSWMLERLGWLHARRGELEQALRELYGDEWKQAVKPLEPKEVSAQLMASENEDSTS